MLLSLLVIALFDSEVAGLHSEFGNAGLSRSATRPPASPLASLPQPVDGHGSTGVGDVGCLGASQPVLCIGFDRRSGRTVESVEDIDGTLAPDELHPVLSWRLLESGARPPAHEHAPVQAINALLLARGPQTGAEALADFSVTTLALDQDSTPVTMCASCTAVLRPVVDTHAAGAAEPGRSAASDPEAMHMSERRALVAEETGIAATPEWIRHNVETVLHHLGPQAPFDLGLDRRSVEWVQGYLERMRTAPELDAARLVPVLGSFLGQCLVETYGGTWVESNREWAVRIPARDGAGSTDAFPFTKTHKQARDGLVGGESILSFFDLVADHRPRAGPRTGPPEADGPAHDGHSGEIRGETRLDVNVLRAMVRASLGARLWLMRALGCLSVVYATLLLVIGGDGAVGSALGAAAFGLAFFGYDEIQTRLGMRQLRKLGDRPWRYRMSDVGVGIDTPATALELRWNAIRRVVRRPGAWVLVTTTGGRIAIPRAAFTPQGAERIDRETSRLAP